VPTWFPRKRRGHGARKACVFCPPYDRRDERFTSSPERTLQRWRELPSVVCGSMAAAFLVGMMLLTVTDVTLRAVFNIPILGTYELIELMLAYSFFIALPAVFLRDENIVVNVIDEFLPRRVRMLRRTAMALAVVILAIMAWQGGRAAADSIAFNDITADLGLPRILHWIALLVGVIGAAVAALTMAWHPNGRR
jgi:TRAP-type C4-dicarboxylate transport system permease small subunit